MAKTYTNQPENVNYLSPVGFRFNVDILPNTNWFITSANLPGVSLAEIPHPTPYIQAAQPGDVLNFDPLIITFLADEDMANWRELFDWMIGLGFPDEHSQYARRKIASNSGNMLSDATLTILNSNMVPNYHIIFKDLFPTSMSEVLFDSASADIEGIKATATFRYLNYSYEKV